MATGSSQLILNLMTRSCVIIYVEKCGNLIRSCMFIIKQYDNKTPAQQIRQRNIKNINSELAQMNKYMNE